MTAKLATLAADPARIEDVQREELPALIGEAEGLRAALWARLQAAATPTPQLVPDSRQRGEDRLLTAKEAAGRLGVAVRWMYRHADTLPFTRKLSSGTLRFSERGLERWQETKRKAA